MPAKRNNIVPNQHFHKDWQNYVKTWFNQVSPNLLIVQLFYYISSYIFVWNMLKVAGLSYYL